jgi:hypothetical protein
MLAVSNYSQEYVDACRANVRAQLAAYGALSELSGDGQPRLDAALDDFELLFFNHMMIALDAYFTHRLRNKEGKDGNAMNEVRLLAQSIMNNDGVLATDKQIRLKPESSVLGYEVGDPIRLGKDDFERLSEAFFAGIERAYV